MAFNWASFAVAMAEATASIINAVQVIHPSKSDTEKFNAAVSATQQVAQNLGHLEPDSQATHIVAGLVQVVYDDMAATGKLIQPTSTSSPPPGSGAPKQAEIPDKYAPAS